MAFDPLQQLPFCLIRSQDQDLILRPQKEEHGLVVILYVQILPGVNAALRPVTIWPIHHGSLQGNDLKPKEHSLVEVNPDRNVAICGTDHGLSSRPDPDDQLDKHDQGYQHIPDRNLCLPWFYPNLRSFPSLILTARLAAPLSIIVQHRRSDRLYAPLKLSLNAD
jgi:hypothetical protein